MRKLTIVIDVEQPEANWLWDTMIERKSIHGIQVWKMGDGDLTTNEEKELLRGTMQLLYDTEDMLDKSTMLKSVK